MNHNINVLDDWLKFGHVQEPIHCIQNWFLIIFKIIPILYKTKIHLLSKFDVNLCSIFIYFTIQAHDHMTILAV